MSDVLTDNLKNNGALTDTGFPVVGRVSWGSHFSIFYETKKDLLDILVAYFKARLEQNELCLWLVGGHEFVTMKAAKEALAKRYPRTRRLPEKRKYPNSNLQTAVRNARPTGSGYSDRASSEKNCGCSSEGLGRGALEWQPYPILCKKAFGGGLK